MSNMNSSVVHATPRDPSQCPSARRAKPIEISPNGRYVAASSSFGDITVWDRSEGRTLALHGNKQEAYYLLFSSDENSLFSAAADGEVRRWDVASGASTLLYVHGADVRGAEWSTHDRTFLTASDDGRVRSYDLISGRESTFATHSGPIARMTASSHGENVAAVNKEGELRDWAEGGNLLFTARSVSFAKPSPDGHLIAIGYDSGLLSLVETSVPNRRGSTLAHRGGITYIGFSEDGTAFVTVGIDGIARKWAVADFAMLSLDRGQASPTFHASKGEDDNETPKW